MAVAHYGPAVGVGDVQRIDRVLGLIGAEAELRNDGA
jgi:hypothetical protein